MTGAFRIYRAPGSVAFLNCGSTLHPILPKSQCWCVEEDASRFVLQIRRPNYWRIELPVAETEDRHRAELLKDVFDKILLFEKTRCPFERSFAVKLPEPPQTPVKKKPWTPAKVRTFVPVGPLRSLSMADSPTPKGWRAVSEPPIETNERWSPLPAEKAEEKAASDGEEERSPSRPLLREKTIADAASNVPSGDEKLPAEVVTEARLSEIEKEATAREADTNQTTAAEHASQDQTLSAPASCSVPSSPSKHLGVSESQGPAPGLDSALIDEDDLLPSFESPAKPRDAVPVKVREAVEAIEERGPEAAKSPESMAEQAVVLDISTPTKPLGRKTSIPFIRNVREPRPRQSTEVLRPLTPATPIKQKPVIDAVPDPVPEKRIEPECQGSEELSSPQDEELTAAASGVGEVHEGSAYGGNLLRKKKLRMSSFAGGRSAAVPPQLTLVASPPSNLPTIALLPTTQPAMETAERKPRSDSTSTDSADSFHSVQSQSAQEAAPTTPAAESPTLDEAPPTFPYPHENILLPPTGTAAHHHHHHHHQRGISDLTITPTPDTRLGWDGMSASSRDDASQESAMTAPDQVLEPVDSVDECVKSTVSDEGVSTAVRTGRSSVRHRSTTSISHRRAFSPLPPAATLLSPTATSSRRKLAASRLPTRLERMRGLPWAIIAKTCELLLGPPSHLVALMLQVAAKIAAGEWRGLVFGFGDDGEKIDVSWDYEDDDLSDWEHDGPVSPRSRRLTERIDEEGQDEQDDDSDDEDDVDATRGEDYTGRSWGVD